MLALPEVSVPNPAPWKRQTALFLTSQTLSLVGSRAAGSSVPGKPVAERLTSWPLPAPLWPETNWPNPSNPLGIGPFRNIAQSRFPQFGSNWMFAQATVVLPAGWSNAQYSACSMNAIGCGSAFYGYCVITVAWHDGTLWYWSIDYCASYPSRAAQRR